MKIPGSASTPIGAPAPAQPVGGAAPAAPAPVAAEQTATLQSAALQPALAALRALPDFDLDRVTALRDALAKGEVPFDAAKLAGLIERFHGGRTR